jgi:hypothetical protein
MLGFFPDPHTDELLYSVFARLNDRLRYQNTALVVEKLFGVKGATAVVDLPTRINHLLSVLPANHNYTADSLIDHHTLAPFYAPFLPIKRVALLRVEMKVGGEAKHIKGRTGNTALSIKTPERLRFCPTCAVEDRKRVGEPYWHRIHQISGVMMCPLHAVFLEDSTALWRNPGNPSKFISASKAIVPIVPRTFEASNFSHIFLLKLAQHAAWLLNWHGHNSDISFLRKRYYNLLLERGLAFYNGRIRTAELSKQLMEFYSTEFLNSLQCNIERYDRGWVYSLVHTNTEQRVQHPLRHLLLMTFLGCTAQEFFTSFEEYNPFGKGPWPCFNKASNHYLESRITDCRIIDSPVKGKPSRPMGTFRCKCGFVYTRMGPDSEDDDRFRVDSVQDYGVVWEKKLRDLWPDSTVTLYQMADILGTAQNTVVRRAIYLGLQYPRTPTLASPSKLVHKRYKIIRRSIPGDLKERRERLLRLIKANPNAGRLELQKLSPYLLDWLRRHDRNWLNDNLPAPRRSRPKGARVDWRSRDKELVATIKLAVKRIRSNDGRPIRVSLAEIIRAIGHQADLEQRLHKLPRTAKVLGTHLESLEAFAIRKVLWAERCYHQEAGRCPTRLQLMVRAVVRNKTGETQSVQDAINAAMERLIESLR